MIDAHIHLDQYNHVLLKDMIDIWQNNGIEGVVAVASNLQSSYEILKLKQIFPNFVRAAIGHHPEAPPPNEKDLAELIDLVKKERSMLSGIGEIGLPTYRKKELLERYKEEDFVTALEQLLSLAKQESLPVALHAVHEEAEKVLSVLKKWNIKKAHFHWLKAPSEVVSEIVRDGFYVSVTPEVCYRERDKKLARLIPVDQLLIETDGPWKHNGPFAARETSPLLLKEMSKCLSNILNIPIDQLNEKISRNTNLLYNGGYL